jgi:NADPH-dependent 2,4-dienoyl-CoA reductase/sulfur reductase-like enzyme
LQTSLLFLELFFVDILYPHLRPINMPDFRVDLGARSVAIMGGGLVGCLLGVYLRKHGFSVAIFESRADPRIAQEVNIRKKEKKKLS